MNTSQYFVCVGNSGFPYGMASSQKLKLICKGIVESGGKACVLNNKAVHRKTEKIKMNSRGRHEGIDYIYTSGTPYKSQNKILEKIINVKGKVNEIFTLISLKKNNKLDYGIISTMKLSSLVFYYIIFELLNVKKYLVYAELVSIRNLNFINRNFENYAFKLVDGVFPVSEYLVNVVRKHNHSMPLIKVPAICDFKKFNQKIELSDDKYFIFVGSAGYFEIINFIIDAYNSIDIPHNFNLIIITHGSYKQLEKIKKKIEKQNSKNNIILLTKYLTYEELINKYKNSKALLIPLRENLQDLARFPHKIAEYTASSKPIISNKWGEVEFYFSDMKNALLAENYSKKEYSEKMKYVIKNKTKAEKIGKKGYILGKKNFDCRIYGNKIIKFVMEN